MGKYCGDSIPPSHTSSNNEVLIHFYSDGMNMEAEAGFKMEYNSRGKQITQFKTTLNIIWIDAEIWLDSSISKYSSPSTYAIIVTPKNIA